LEAGLSSLSDTLSDVVEGLPFQYANSTYQFELTTTYVDDKITEQHGFTDQEIENLRNEGYIQKAVTQILAWATNDEGKRFRKKVWDIPIE
jgi:hypothetical protein